MSKKLLTVIMGITMMGTVFTGCGKTETASEKNENDTVIMDTPAVMPDSDDGAAEMPDADDQEDNTEEGQSGQAYGEIDPSAAKEDFFVVTDGLELPAQADMPADMFADTYGIDPQILESYYVSIAEMNVHATEIAVFRVKESKDIDAVKAGIEKRQQALVQQWQSYLPEQLELVENYKMEVNGDRVIFVISYEADQIIEKFKSL